MYQHALQLLFITFNISFYASNLKKNSVTHYDRAIYFIGKFRIISQYDNTLKLSNKYWCVNVRRYDTTFLCNCVLWVR